MKKVIVLVALMIVALAWGMAGAEGSIFDSEYTKYPREIYEKYCDHHLTPGGYWDCLDALDRNGIPEMGCDEPIYEWSKDKYRYIFNVDIWEPAPLNFSEDVINQPYAPKVYWFYKCPGPDFPLGGPDAYREGTGYIVVLPYGYDISRYDFGGVTIVHNWELNDIPIGSVYNPLRREIK